MFLQTQTITIVTHKENATIRVTHDTQHKLKLYRLKDQKSTLCY